MANWNTFLRATLALAWACSGEGSAAGPSRLLCAECSALPPPDLGENPLLSGAVSPCTIRSTEVGRDFEGFGLSAAPAVQLVEQHASLLGRFRPTVFSSTWSEANEVRGHGDAPQVDVTVEVTSVALDELEGPPGCEGRTLELRARISVSTSDGALSGSFEDAHFTFQGSTEAQTYVSTDARTFTGSLDFGSDHEPPIENLVASLYLTLAPGSVRGDLDLAVITADGPSGALALEWPVDGCPPRQQPVSEAEFLPVLEATRRTFGKSHPIRARWAAAQDYRGGQSKSTESTGPFTELALELNGPFRAGCRTLLGADGRRASYLVETEAMLSTDDGRIDGRMPGQLNVDTDESRTPFHATFSIVRQFAAADLEASFGIHGVDMLGSPCGLLFFSDRANIEGGETSGSLEIATRPCADAGREPARLTEFLSWCSGPCSFGEGPWFTRSGVPTSAFE